VGLAPPPAQTPVLPAPGGNPRRVPPRERRAALLVDRLGAPTAEMAGSALAVLFASTAFASHRALLEERALVYPTAATLGRARPPEASVRPVPAALEATAAQPPLPLPVRHLPLEHPRAAARAHLFSAQRTPGSLARTPDTTRTTVGGAMPPAYLVSRATMEPVPASPMEETPAFNARQGPTCAWANNFGSVLSKETTPNMMELARATQYARPPLRTRDARALMGPAVVFPALAASGALEAPVAPQQAAAARPSVLPPTTVSLGRV
jgi:hypothetical protein